MNTLSLIGGGRQTNASAVVQRRLVDAASTLGGLA
jgi:hypothetical protein